MVENGEINFKQSIEGIEAENDLSNITEDEFIEFAAQWVAQMRRNVPPPEEEAKIVRENIPVMDAISAEIQRRGGKRIEGLIRRRVAEI